MKIEIDVSEDEIVDEITQRIKTKLYKKSKEYMDDFIEQCVQDYIPKYLESMFDTHVKSSVEKKTIECIDYYVSELIKATSRNTCEVAINGIINKFKTDEEITNKLIEFVALEIARKYKMNNTKTNSLALALLNLERGDEECSE